MCENGQVAVVKCSPIREQISKHFLSLNRKFIFKQKHGNILSFLCCWYLVEKKTYERGKRFLYFYSYLLNPKISFFIGKEEGGVCAKRDVTQEGSREQM